MTGNLDAFCERCGKTALSPAIGQAAGGGVLRRLLPSARAGRPDAPDVAALRLCLGCRGYICAECWNNESGVCQSCQPLEGVGVGVASEAEAEPLRPGVEIVDDEPVSLTYSDAAWPATDLRRRAPEPEVEPSTLDDDAVEQAEAEQVAAPEPSDIEAAAEETFAVETADDAWQQLMERIQAIGVGQTDAAQGSAVEWTVEEPAVESTEDGPAAEAEAEPAAEAEAEPGAVAEAEIETVAEAEAEVETVAEAEAETAVEAEAETVAEAEADAVTEAQPEATDTEVVSDAFTEFELEASIEVEPQAAIEIEAEVFGAAEVEADAEAVSEVDTWAPADDAAEAIVAAVTEEATVVADPEESLWAAVLSDSDAAPAGADPDTTEPDRGVLSRTLQPRRMRRRAGRQLPRRAPRVVPSAKPAVEEPTITFIAQPEPAAPADESGPQLPPRTLHLPTALPPPPPTLATPWPMTAPAAFLPPPPPTPSQTVQPAPARFRPQVVEEVVKPATRTCANCGLELSAKVAFCRRCGTRQEPPTA